MGFTLSIVGPDMAVADKSQLVFSTPPTQSPEVTVKNYQPLVDFLSKTIGQKIVIAPAKNYVEYTKNMREGNYDLLLDGPHFIKWRIDNQHNVVLAKQPGELHFVVVVNKSSGIDALRGLWGKSICAPPVPHLGTLSIIEQFDNPIREPEIVPVQSFQQGIECLRSNKAPAAMVRDVFWKNLPNKDDLKVVYTTPRKMPPRALTANSRLSKTASEKITNALTSAEGKEYAEKAFSTIGGGYFVKANTAEYDELGELIKLVWGFHMQPN